MKSAVNRDRDGGSDGHERRVHFGLSLGGFLRQGRVILQTRDVVHVALRRRFEEADDRVAICKVVVLGLIMGAR